MEFQLSWLNSALTAPEDHFKTLWREIVIDSSVDAAIDIRYNFAEVTIRTADRGKAILYIPLKPIELTANKAFETPPSSQLCPYIVLKHEMIRFDGISDVIIQFIPEGAPLSTTPIASNLALQMIDNLERECHRVGFSHNMLTAENIILGTDNRLYPIRYHFATMDGATDDFNSLRLLYIDGNQLLCDVESQYTTNSYERFDSQNGTVRFCKEGLYGFCDNLGKEIIPARYKWAGNFFENRAIVETDNGCGVIDSSGNEIIPPYLDNIYFDTFNTIFYYYEDGILCGFDYNGTPLKTDSPLLDHLR